MDPFSILTYHVWCRTEELGPDQHLVTVFAVPVPHVDGAEATSESRLFVSCELAASEGERMTDAMTRRLASAGHRVAKVTVLKGDDP
jgi:hypothetical protein